jgi:glycosyltransferase involved in cell wall biosynthesis
MTNWGGIERMLVDFFTNVKQKNVFHSLVTTSSSTHIIEQIKKAGIKVFEPYRFFHYDPRAIFYMARWLKSNEIDIVHTYNLYGNCWGGLAAYLANTPIKIAGEHGSVWYPKSTLTFLENFVLKKVDLIISNSAATKQMLAKKRDFPEEKIKIVHNGVKINQSVNISSSVNLLREFNILNHEIVIGTIARFCVSKDLFTWLDTAKIIGQKYPHCRFIVVGDGPLKNKVTSYAKSIKIFDKVTFTGWRADAREILELFHIYLSSSIHESFGNTLVEASLKHIPIIAPNVDGISDIIINGKTGFLIEPDQEVHTAIKYHNDLVKTVVINGQLTSTKSVSPDKLAEKVFLLLNDEKKRVELINSAYERVNHHFSIDRYINEIENVYKSLYYEKLGSTKKN